MKDKDGPEEKPFIPDRGNLYDPSMRDVANLVLESLEEGYKTEGEPFEVYAQKLKSHIHTDPDIFRQRFTEGYEGLLEVLYHKPEKQE